MTGGATAQPSDVEAMLVAKMAEPTFTATPKQSQFITDVLSGKWLYMAMGGGIRGTKTWSTISTLIILCRIFPRSRWAIVRKDLPTLRRNTVPSINKLRGTCEGFLGELNQSTWSYACVNGSEILIFPESFQQDPDLERWRGLEVNGFLLEEANEITEMAANKAIERAGSWIIPPTKYDPKPQQPPPLVMFTFNPCPNWPRVWFWDPYSTGSLKPPYYFLPATQVDNPFIPEQVREAWKNLPVADYNRFIRGEWDFIDDPDQLIKTEWIFAARNVEEVLGPNRLAVDVARFGDDETVLCRGRGNALVDIKAYSKLSTDKTADYVLNLAGDAFFPINAEEVRIDTVGVGGGVADNVRRVGLDVTEIVAGASAWVRKVEGEESFYKFKNLRSQMWWEAREKLRLGQAPLPQDLHPKLVADLTAVHYRIHADRTVEVESKDDVKKRIGRSTDYGDSYVMMLLDLPERSLNKRMIPSTYSFSSLR
jgi:hypothetical protein